MDELKTKFMDLLHKQVGSSNKIVDKLLLPKFIGL